jgi:hypothetical protein
MIEDRVKFIRNHLLLGNRIGPVQQQSVAERNKLIRQFTTEYLRHDGVFIFRLIAHNTNNITTTEVVCALWDQWKDKCSLSSKGDENPSHELYSPTSETDTLTLKK